MRKNKRNKLLIGVLVVVVIVALFFAFRNSVSFSAFGGIPANSYGLHNAPQSYATDFFQLTSIVFGDGTRVVLNWNSNSGCIACGMAHWYDVGTASLNGSTVYYHSDSNTTAPCGVRTVQDFNNISGSPYNVVVTSMLGGSTNGVYFCSGMNAIISCKDGFIWNDKSMPLNLGGKTALSVTSASTTNFCTPAPTENNLFLSVQKPSAQVLQGEQVVIRISITNLYKPVRGNFSATFIVPTTIGDMMRTESRIINLSMGVTEFVYNINTSLVTNELRVNTTFDALDSSGLYSIKRLDVSNFVLQINPTPIYIDRDCLNEGCPSGYTCQESGLCLRIDIITSQLTCQQLGCPTVDGHNYECSSAGLCTETVYKYVDCTSKGCGEGFTCQNDTGVCIKTEIFNQIVQCSNAEDCMNPCNGVVAGCKSGKCEYSGSCLIAEVQCSNDAGCPASPCKGVVPSCSGGKCSYLGTCEVKEVKVIPWTYIIWAVGVIVVLSIALLLKLRMDKKHKRRRR